MEKIVVASGNKDKIREIRQIFSEFEIIACNELGADSSVEEDGASFYENALKKAKRVFEQTGLCTVADDSGICVKSLGWQPGVRSARYSESGNDADNNAKLLSELSAFTDRTAKYACSTVMILPNGSVLSGYGETHGVILEKAQGNNGFGYDPLFYSTEIDKCFGEATPEEKNAVSHRARALNELREKLRKQ